MSRYPKPREPKTAFRGLRPFSTPSSDSFSQSLIQKTETIIEKLLANSQPLDEKDTWIIEQALLAVSFRQAQSVEEKNEITQAINKHEKEGHRLGFDEDTIRSINRVALKKDLSGQLDVFREQLLKRSNSKGGQGF